VQVPRRPAGWGVDAVIASALKLHARIPPSTLYTVIGVRPDPAGAFAAYPYPRWGSGRGVWGAGGRVRGAG
jgi:hypothetical protein